MLVEVGWAHRQVENGLPLGGAQSSRSPRARPILEPLQARLIPAPQPGSNRVVAAAERRLDGGFALPAQRGKDDLGAQSFLVRAGSLSGAPLQFAPLSPAWLVQLSEDVGHDGHLHRMAERASSIP